jgi:tripartite-type tricarboxylate transporter receptor subunit TctC
MPRILFSNFFSAALCAVAAWPAHAAYPERSVTLIVPFPAGGPSDVLARAVAQRMGNKLGQPVVVENAGGAGGTIGIEKVAKSKADGYTLAFGTIGTHVINTAVYRKLPYDPIASFEPVGLLGSAPIVLLGKAGLSPNNLREFAKFVGENKGKLSYGSAGIGSISHYGCLMMLSALNADVTHVPYRGAAPAMNDLLGGQIDFMCDQSTTAIPQASSGRVKPIAVLTREKLDQLPDISTAAATGYDLDLRSWNALFAPKGTPPEVMMRLIQALGETLKDPELRAQMQKVGVDMPTPAQSTPATVAAYIQLGLKNIVPVVKSKAQYLD